MRAILLILVVVLAFVGYEYVYKREPPPRTVEQATRQAGEAAAEAGAEAREAVRAATRAAGPAVQEAADALRRGTERLSEGASRLGQEAAERARRAAAAKAPDIGLQAREAVERARASFAAVVDRTTAEGQLLTLRDVEARLGDVEAAAEGLGAEARRGLAATADELLPSFQAAAERVKAIDGLGPEVRAAIDRLLARLDAWSKAPS